MARLLRLNLTEFWAVAMVHNDVTGLKLNLFPLVNKIPMKQNELEQFK
jgi:hypothetical protein